MRYIGLIWVTILFLVSNIICGQDHLYINRTLQDFAAKMEFSGSGMINQRPGVIQTRIDGSAYLNDKFEEGEIYTTENVRFTGIPMRFDAYHDAVEVLMPDDKIYVLANTNKIIKISLDSAELVHTRFLSSEGERAGYLSLIYNGMSTLYRRDYKVFKEGTPSNGIINEIPPRIIDRPKEYYVRTNAGLPRYFKTTKDLTELLVAHSSEIKSFLKKERINVKKEADLVKVLTYFDSLN